jgi:hypothetical protein
MLGFGADWRSFTLGEEQSTSGQAPMNRVEKDATKVFVNV